MAENTLISWTDHSWNPWQGCRKVSPGCFNCYMYRDKKRYGQDPQAVKRSSLSTFNMPLRIKEPAKIFTCSWSDFFIEEADDWREAAWDIIRKTPHLTYQILTKRPERIKDCLPSDWGNGWTNVWLMTTVESQEQLYRAALIEDIPAVVHGISVEPMIGPVDLESYFGIITLDWVICGGESGPGARPMHPNWARSLRDQCVAAGVPFFFKQWGEWAPIDQPWKCDEDIKPLRLNERWLNLNGGHGFHGEEVWRMRGVGSKNAGHLLDGQEWRQFPEVSA